MQVREYTPSRVTLGHADLAYLLGMVKATGTSEETRLLQAVTPTVHPDEFEVTPGPYVGRLALPSGNWLDFTSRFPFRDVMRLILDSGRLPARIDPSPTPARADRFLVDLVARAFAREVLLLAGRGLAKGYQDTRRTQPPYPGRLDVAYHLGQLAARPDRLATIARRLTIDTPENQALAAALDVLSRLPLSSDAQREIGRLLPVFRLIRRVPVSAESPSRLRLTSLTARYRAALGLAEVILRGQSIAPQGEGKVGSSILFFMPKAWEGYLAGWFTRRYPELRVEAPYRFDLTNDGQPAEADITLWDGPELVGLFDAKYKRPGSAPDRADLYQMVTYCERLGVNEATLVYPLHSVPQVVGIGEVTIRTMGVQPLPLEDIEPDAAASASSVMPAA